MPHIVTYVSQRGKDQIDLTHDRGYRAFTRTLEVVVATEFNRRIGERLVAGETCVSDHFQVSKTMPRDISVVILAWRTTDRVRHQRFLQRTIQLALTDIFGPSADLNIQVFLNIVGDPTGRS